MNTYDQRKFNITKELRKSIESSKFLGNTALAGFIATGAYTGLNPTENFTTGVLSTLALSAGLLAEKNLSQKKVNFLINKYEDISHSSAEPISEKLLPPNERSTRPRKLSIKGIAESTRFAGILGGVSEAGAFLLTNSESTNRAFSLGLGAIALAGAASINYAFNKMVAEDLNFRTEMQIRNIEENYN